MTEAGCPPAGGQSSTLFNEFDAVRVGIALVRRDGSYLVRRRPPGTAMAGFWEFPGGKCEPGESPESATVRECAEETGLAVRVITRRHLAWHEYPHGRVELHFYDCETIDPAAVPDPATDFRWVGARVLPSLAFPAGNAALLVELARESEELGPPP